MGNSASRIPIVKYDSRTTSYGKINSPSKANQHFVNFVVVHDNMKNSSIMTEEDAIGGIGCFDCMMKKREKIDNEIMIEREAKLSEYLDSNEKTTAKSQDGYFDGGEFVKVGQELLQKGSPSSSNVSQLDEEAALLAPSSPLPISADDRKITIEEEEDRIFSRQNSIVYQLEADSESDNGIVKTLCRKTSRQAHEIDEVVVDSNDLLNNKRARRSVNFRSDTLDIDDNISTDKGYEANDEPTIKLRSNSSLNRKSTPFPRRISLLSIELEETRFDNVEDEVDIDELYPAEDVAVLDDNECSKPKKFHSGTSGSQRMPMRKLTPFPQQSLSNCSTSTEEDQLQMIINRATCAEVSFRSTTRQSRLSLHSIVEEDAKEEHIDTMPSSSHMIHDYEDTIGNDDPTRIFKRNFTSLKRYQILPEMFSFYNILLLQESPN